jgi:hypothetical protein
MNVTEDIRPVRARAIPATEWSRMPAPNLPETGRRFKKDVKIDGTNSVSPLE